MNIENNDDLATATEEKNTKPKTIGELIKLKREQKNLSLKVISQQTKIHIGLLEYLELDQLDKLPSKTYVKGFIKSTAKILGLNQEEALELLERTYNDKKIPGEKKSFTANLPPQESTATLHEKNPVNFENIKSVSLSYLTSGLKFGAILVVVGIIGFNLKNYIEKSSDESKAKLPVVLTTIHQKTRPVARTIIAKAEVKNAILTPPVPIKVNLIQDKKDGSEKKEIVVKDVSLKPVSIAEKQFTPDSSKLDADKLEEIFPAKYHIKPTKGVENIFINATEGDSWVTYKVDDKDIKKYVLRQGRTVFLRGGNIRLFLGNIKNIKVFYNNQLLNLNTGKSGIKNLVFPEELKTKYMNPLFVFQKDGTVVTSDEFISNNKDSKTPGDVNIPTTHPATARSNKE